jgi:protein TonB
MKWFLAIVIVSSFSLMVKAQKASLPQPPSLEGMSHGQSEVDKMATFPGGIRAYNKFLSKNLKWPGDEEATGRVIVSFYIEKDGRLTNFKIVKSMGREFDAEALRVLKKSPKWIPAMKNGKTIRIKYAVPINFTLSS